jgi:hypothetical protein
MQHITHSVKLALASVTLAIAAITPAGAFADSMHQNYCKTHHHLTHQQMRMHHCPTHSMSHH